MKTISYYIFIIAVFTAALFTGCSDDDEKPLPVYTGKLSIYDFAPTTGKGGTELLINGEQFPLDAGKIKVTINNIGLTIIDSNEDQILVEIPDNDAIGTAPVSIDINGQVVESKESFVFQKAKVVSFSPTYGKVGTEVYITIENMPVNINTLTATFNGLEADCTADDKSITVTIPETEAGVYPIIINLNGRNFTVEGFEYKEAIFERTVTTLAGHPDRGWGFVNGPGLEARFKFTGWIECRGGICVDDDGNVFVTDMWNCAVRKIAPDGTVSTFAKTYSNGPDDNDNADWGANWRLENGGNGTTNVWLWAYGMDMDKDGNLFVVNTQSAHMVRYDTQGLGYYFGWLSGIGCAIDKTRGIAYIMTSGGDIYMKDNLNDYGASPASAGTKIISNGAAGGMVVDERTGDLYATNTTTHTIIKYPYNQWDNGVVIAGSGTPGNTDGAAEEATFDQPWGLAFTPEHNLLVAGTGTAFPANGGYLDSAIRHIDLTTGIVTTFAGGAKGAEDASFTIEAYAGVNSSQTSLPASFGAPSAICVDKEGAVYVLDRDNNCVKKITTIEK